MPKVTQIIGTKAMVQSRALTMASEAQLVGESYRASKGCRFDSWSGHVPRLWVRSLVGAHMGHN